MRAAQILILICFAFNLFACGGDTSAGGGSCTKLAETDLKCDGVDEDCDGQTDEDYVATSCGQGACAAVSACAGGVEQTCAPGTPAATDATCDGVDDNCDGQTDEGYVATACGQGACAATSACVAGVEQTCTPGTPAAADATCDGKDDNCDGQTDEGYVATACGQGACAAVSACVAGVEQTCTPGTPAADDATCNGVDDDCNGQVDDGYVAASCGQGACAATSSCNNGQEQACTPGPPAAADTTCDGVDDNCDGETDEGYVPTTCGQGACAAVSACVNGAEQACTPGQPAAADSVCDGVDDDCDGELDEDYQVRVCGQGACASTSVCFEGVEQACTPGQAAADDASCDGVDQDCDGQVDEDYLVTACGVGACGATSRCENGAVIECAALPPAADDASCNGADDDCDGETDEDYAPTRCGQGACAATSACVDGAEQACAAGQPAGDDASCNGVDDDCNGEIDEDYVPTSCGQGVCAASTSCVAGQVVPCQAGQPTGDDADCDGSDNDCDGQTDEGYMPQSCGVGGCQATSSCVNGMEQACTAGQPAVNDAACDGIDNDCDGETDEDYVPQPCGIGACASQSACVAGQEQACQSGAPLADLDTTCDQVDDDCDGQTDEEFSETCGEGVCMAVAVCDAGQVECTQGLPLGPDDRTCDDVDDDCDGVVDEDCLQNTFSLQAQIEGDQLVVRISYSMNAGESYPDRELIMPRILDLWPRWETDKLTYVGAELGAASVEAQKDLLVGGPRVVPDNPLLSEVRFLVMTTNNTNRIYPGEVMIIRYTIVGAGSVSFSWNLLRTQLTPDEADDGMILEETTVDLGN